MRNLSLAVIALAMLAGCSSSSTQRSAAPAAPAPQPTAASGSMEPAEQGDSIDRFAAAYAAAHPMRRY